MAKVWIAERDGEIAEEAGTKAEVVFLVTSTHLDVRRNVVHRGERGVYYYTSPRGRIYRIRQIKR